MVQSQPRQIVCETLSQKYPMGKRAGGVFQVLACLLSKCEVLNSNPSTTHTHTHTHAQREEQSNGNKYVSGGMQMCLDVCIIKWDVLRFINKGINYIESLIEKMRYDPRLEESEGVGQVDI
jgi:hypothetical protein